MDPIAPRPDPEQQPPRGVPRWLWPPPGASVETLAIVGRVNADGTTAYAVAQGEAPSLRHLRALRWLLDEHHRADPPREGGPIEGRVLLSIARTELPGGRIGHAYALDGGPLGAPSGGVARGIVWGYIEATLGP